MKKDRLSPLAIVQRAELFGGLPEPERRQLAARAQARHYVPGQRVVAEGERGDSLFIVGEGVVSVWIKIGEQTLQVASLGAGSFFGEMAVLTGMPRAATVVAETPAFLLEIGKADLAPVLAARPELVRRLNDIVSQRRQAPQAGRPAERFLDKLCGFFGGKE